MEASSQCAAHVVLQYTQDKPNTVSCVGQFFKDRDPDGLPLSHDNRVRGPWQTQ